MSKPMTIPMNTQLKAEAHFDLSAIDSEKKKVSFILSDETKVTRFSWSNGHYMLQLLHGEENIDLSRAGIMKLFYQHETHGSTPPIGKLENIRIEDKKLKADAYFDAEDEFAMQIFGKIERGFLESVSVGISVLKGRMKKFENKPNEFTASVWQLNEVSVVNIPAIPTAKVGLSQENFKGEGMDEELTQESVLKDYPKIAQAFKDEGIKIGLSQGATAERERILSIQKLSQPGYEEVITEALSDNEMTPEKVKVKLFDAMQSKRDTSFSEHKADGESLGKDLSELSGSKAEGGDGADEDQAVLAQMTEAGKQHRGEA